MIHFINGKPGGGKSLFSVSQIIEELRTSRRFIVTNVRLKLDELEKYMQDEFGENPHGENPGEPWVKRIRLLDDLEAKKFWLYPAPDCDITERLQEGESRVNSKGVTIYDIDFPKWEQFPHVMERGTFFVIDEVHDHFNAREWMKNSTDGIYWASKHRHLWQDAMLLTQHPEMCDKNFRRLAQDFTTLRNFGNEPVLGFQFKGRFRRAKYSHEKKPGDNQTALTSGWFRLNKRVANCYHTHGTTGILERTDVKESSGGGRSPWWILVIVLAVIAGLWFLPGLITGTIKGGLKMAVQKGNDVVQDVAQEKLTDIAEVPERAKRAEAAKTEVSNNETLSEGETALAIKSIQIVGMERKYVLSNGRVITADDPQVTRAGENYFIHKRYGYISK